MWFSITATEPTSSAAATSSCPAKAGHDSYPRISVIPIRPRPPLLAEGEAGIDVAVDASAGRARHAFGEGRVKALARTAPPAALDAVGIMDRGGGPAAGHRGGSRRQ